MNCRYFSKRLTVAILCFLFASASLADPASSGSTAPKNETVVSTLVAYGIPAGLAFICYAVVQEIIQQICRVQKMRLQPIRRIQRIQLIGQPPPWNMLLFNYHPTNSNMSAY